MSQPSPSSHEPAARHTSAQQVPQNVSRSRCPVRCMNSMITLVHCPNQRHVQSDLRGEVGGTRHARAPTVEGQQLFQAKRRRLAKPSSNRVVATSIRPRRCSPGSPALPKGGRFPDRRPGLDGLVPSARSANARARLGSTARSDSTSAAQPHSDRIGVLRQQVFGSREPAVCEGVIARALRPCSRERSTVSVGGRLIQAVSAVRLVGALPRLDDTRRCPTSTSGPGAKPSRTRGRLRR